MVVQSQGKISLTQTLKSQIQWAENLVSSIAPVPVKNWRSFKDRHSLAAI